MKTELLKLNLAFRGLSDEDEDEANLDEQPDVLEDGDDDEDDLGTEKDGGAAADDGPAPLEE